jgi:hypothetical protein
LSYRELQEFASSRRQRRELDVAGCRPVAHSHR